MVEQAEVRAHFFILKSLQAGIFFPARTLKDAARGPIPRYYVHVRTSEPLQTTH